jgi:hypothetical protein
MNAIGFHTEGKYMNGVTAYMPTLERLKAVEGGIFFRRTQNYAAFWI